MAATVSPLAPTIVPDMPAIAGVRLATAAAGIKYPNRTDVLLALFDPGTAVAGVFTRSKCPSAPVEWCRARSQARQGARAGGQFRQRQRLHRQDRPRTACKFTAEIAAQRHRLQAERSLPRLDRRDRRAARRQGIRRRDGRPGRRRASRSRWLDAAKAIMTTDTFPKVATATRQARQGRRSPSTASPRAPA